VKNSDDAVEKVLAGFGDAEAPDGMERRILDALEERGAAGSRTGWRWLLPMWSVVPGQRIAVRYLVGGAALAGVFCVALAVPAIRRLGHGSSRVGMGVASVAPAEVAPAEVEAGVAAKDAGRSSDGSRVRSTGTTWGHGARLVRAADARAEDSEESVAWREMHAASFPAPPMPLTEQERLLLKIAHRGDPVEMAMLDPKIRAAREREEEAEVQRFFVRPKMQVAPEQGGGGQTATAVSVAGGEEKQQQIPSGDDNKKGSDNRKSNGNDDRKSNDGDNRKENGDKSAAPEEPAVEPALPLPAMTQAVPQKITTGENR
jgi:hypothetical protein